jgi:hypothetical protein
MTLVFAPMFLVINLFVERNITTTNILFLVCNIIMTKMLFVERNISWQRFYF